VSRKKTKFLLFGFLRRQNIFFNLQRHFLKKSKNRSEMACVHT
jgi:hypothetical protein